MNALRQFLAIMVTGSCLLCGSHRAYAGGIPVIDVSNLSQNILTAIQTLQSNINEAKQIANQIQSLENEFRNLESLEFSTVDDYRLQFQALFEAIGRVNGLMNDYADLERRFEDTYPNWNRSEESLPSEVISEKARDWLDKSRESILGASLTGAKVLENLPDTQAKLEELVQNSQDAVGILQATQAGNQIAAQIAGNLSNLNSQLAKYSEAHMSYLLQMEQEDAATRNRMDHVLDSLYEGRRAPARQSIQPLSGAL